MDQREDQFQTKGICSRLYNFMTKTLAIYALKSVKLGHPLHKNFARARTRPPCNSDLMVQPVTQEETPFEGVEQTLNIKNSDPFFPNSSSINGLKQEGKELQEVQENNSNFNGEKIEAKVPKKVVSINDRVEEIDTSKKRIRRKKSKENLTSFEQEEEEPKPLKSILKVGSFSGEKSNSFVNRTSDE
ncbi:hypothetical protein JCGZ_23389 [Jatropha curcas]|uniref:Uncharacterized protein n=1 Tax=Jatropha curcas TaxID=180498 RepID=A0A067JHY1_JATCU|nr:uncharacterized protein LOC105647588 [Jatropha curcas]KDP23556.1 hypothetical protein JCGZ_23389 [Jatropha curcas]